MPTPHPLPTNGRPDVSALVEALRRQRARTRADRALARQVQTAFDAPGAAPARGLHFYIFEGAVSVYGAVATFAERNGVLDRLAGIPGATQIADHITVLS